MSVLATTKDMTREAWIEARKRGIGGSDAAAVCGLDPCRSPMAVWLEKTEQVECEEAGEAAHWGTKIEALVADEFAEQTGFRVQRRNAILQHPVRPWMLANVDRLVRDDTGAWGVLEIKSTSAWHRDDWTEDRIPERVSLQVAHYLAVTGCAFGFVAVLIGGQQYRHYRVERDEDLIRSLIGIEGRFWSLVESRTPPAVDGSEASTEALARLYPAAKADSQMVLPADARALIDRYRECSEALKGWEKERDEAGNRLKALLGDAEDGYLDGQCAVTWRNTTSHRLDAKALKAVDPAIWARYATESTTRRFLVK